LELFEDEAETQRWLSTPVTLGGQTPLSALSTDAGAKKVEEILYQAEYGMFGAASLACLQKKQRILLSGEGGLYAPARWTPQGFRAVYG